MIKNNAAQSGENACRNESSLDSRYGEIGIPAGRSGAAVPERGQEPGLRPGRPSTGEVDRGDGSLIAPRGRRLSQAFSGRMASVPLGASPRPCSPCSLFLQDQA